MHEKHRRTKNTAWGPIGFAGSRSGALSPARRSARREDDPLTETTAYLLLDVGRAPCALAQASVSEVLPLPRLHRPPAGGGPLAGFLDLGGVPVPVIELAGLLGLGGAGPDRADDPYRHLVLAADRGIAFLVDRVQDLVRVEASALRPVPDDRTLNGCVTGEIATARGLVHVLDLARLLTREERLRIDAHARAASDRLAAFPANPA